ncbi:MAG: prepilin peptidase [Planctomycetaceae bacterium]|nr:prepilin peptidase [Planctomycetaceae bacterium]
MELHPATLVLILAAGIFTAAAAVWDTRTRRIPNFLTLPMFGLGWVFQIVMSVLYGWEHLASGFLGFAVGFGILFLLWFVGSGGAGDVKLMGALSVWLGFSPHVVCVVRQHSGGARWNGDGGPVLPGDARCAWHQEEICRHR